MNTTWATFLSDKEYKHLDFYLSTHSQVYYDELDAILNKIANEAYRLGYLDKTKDFPADLTDKGELS